GRGLGWFGPAEARRLPGFESTAVRLTYAVGINAERSSRRNCRAMSAFSFPIVICGLFFNASASAWRSVRVVAALAGACVGPIPASLCCWQWAPPASDANRNVAVSTFLVFMLIPQPAQPLSSDGQRDTQQGPGRR